MSARSFSDHPGWLGRAIRKLAQLCSKALYRSIEVRRATRNAPGCPDLLVANHFGGFSDPIVVIAATERLPRFLAAAGLFEVPGVRAVLRGVGAIPVLRSKDLRTQGGDNVSMFAKSHEALAEGDLVAIFPEGVSRDVSRIEPVKTGAARIALGAAHDGVRGVRIVPVGIHYADKAALRSRVFVNVGDAIELDEHLDSPTGAAPPSESDRAAVQALTVEIEGALRRAAPDYESFEEQRVLRTAARIALRSSSGATDIDFAAQEQIANELATRSHEQRCEVVSAVQEYEQELEALDLDDLDLAGGPTSRQLAAGIARSLVVGVLLLPFAIVGAVLNAVPVAILVGVGRRKMAAAMMATVKPLVALGAFGLTWGLFAWIGWRIADLAGVAAVLLLMPMYGAAAILVSERLVLIGRAWARWRRSQVSGSLTDRLVADRARVVAAVRGL